MNPMREVRIEKVTLNIGAGKDQARLEKGLSLLKHITSSTPIKTVTNKRVQEWGLRPGLPIGCKITLRKQKALELLKRLLEAKDNKLKLSQFDENGNISFGIGEYIDIPEVKYDPKIGIMGLEVCITLERRGFRIKRRRQLARKVPNSHKIKKQDSVEFIKSKFNVEIEEQQ